MLGVVGDLVEDVVVWFHGTHRYGTDGYGSDSYGTDTSAVIHRCRGGSAANVAALSAPLVATRFIGCVGADRVGDALVADLIGRGVETLVQHAGRTGTCVILVDGTGERTMFPDRAAAAQLRDVPLEHLDGLGVLHVPSYGFAAEPAAGAICDLLLAARDAGVEVSLDASSTGMLTDYGVARYLDLVGALRPTLFFANAREAELLDVGRSQFAGTVCVVKNGAQPTVVRDRNGVEHVVPVPRVDGVRDSTGAGDAFAAGFLAAHLRGCDPVGAAHAGHVLARTVLQSPGATDTVPATAATGGNT